MLEYSQPALEEAAAGYRRIEDFLHRAVDLLGDVEVGQWTAAFAEAMDDDVAVPRALAEIHNTVRAGNSALADKNTEEVRRLAETVRAMTGVLGVDPLAPQWAGAGSSDDTSLHHALDVLVRAELERRTVARAEKDWDAADSVRDRLNEAGVDVTDTPDGPQWSIK